MDKLNNFQTWLDNKELKEDFKKLLIENKNNEICIFAK